MLVPLCPCMVSKDKMRGVSGWKNYTGCSNYFRKENAQISALLFGNSMQISCSARSGLSSQFLEARTVT